MSNLSEYISSSADRMSLEKGRGILFKTGSVYRIIYDEKKGEAYYRVRGLDSARWYEVRLSGLNEGQEIKAKCTCNDYVPLCQHKVAALMHLDIDQHGPSTAVANETNKAAVVDTTGESEIQMQHIELTTVMLNTGTADWPVAKLLSSDGRVRISHAADFQVRAIVEFKNEQHRVQITKTADGRFVCQCNCADRIHRLCVHKSATLLAILSERGEHYFDYLRNWDKEKNELLSEYGFSLADDIEGKFDFTYVKGNIQLKLLSKGLRKLSAFDNYKDLVPYSPKDKVGSELMGIDTRLVQVKAGENRLGVCWIFSSELPYPGFSLGIFSAKYDSNTSLPTSHFIQHDFGVKHPAKAGVALDYKTLQAVQALHEDTLRQLFYARNVPNVVTQELKNTIDDYFLRKLPEVFEQLADDNDMYYSNEFTLHVRSLQKMRMAPERVHVLLRLEVGEVLAQLKPVFIVDEVELPPAFCNFLGTYILRCGDTLYLFERPELAEQLKVFRENDAISVHKSGVDDFIAQVVLPYRAYFKVEVPPAYELPTRYIPLAKGLFLQEQEPYLFLKPIFEYGNHQVTNDGRSEIVTTEANGPVIILRDLKAEREFYEAVRSSHASFMSGQSSSFFHIHSRDILRDRWFLRFLQQMQDDGVQIYGYQDLRKFRYNTAKPLTKLQVGSGLDWFDVQLEVSFGDLKVSIAEIRKALLAKRDYVELSDGTLGVLPEEWIAKYGLLLKIGEKKADGVKISKIHFSLIEELHADLEDEQLRNELAEKQKRLDAFDTVKKVPVPANIKAELRPYQVDGYHWLHFLHEFGWGGILADDMGLGKTIQAITFIQALLNENADARFLVICPMSLIYNWENEIGKFTEGINYYIHHGPLRRKNKEHLKTAQIILTSYGTVRSDIEYFRETVFEYIILDESQAIKNPMSLSSKAVQLLKTKNRLCLSGTPLQNNTFDLYTQLHFCNPGMLGSLEFFREHFSNPIDRGQDPEALSQLRKLSAPFILRRVKEEVAKDLPEKIESIIFCEMDTEQRKIYDSVRDDIRDQLLSQIDKQGIERSGIFILQGLTKLRQICDSPAILNDANAYPNHSVKLEELIREIKENVSNHKALVFSQFLGMLDLIRRQLEENNIEYAYFDGSSNLQQRQEAIDKFQNTESCRIFLISLKAGGVGLNLTAADYVYVVDPWWNPAVEQQAIDRTHRIGQDKTIFAYRMICKETVEEKIIQLQQRKRELAANLISNDQAFISKLTREDIVFLLT